MAASPRKVEIMTAARDLLAMRGFSRTTMAAIAAEVGVVESALYRHFTSKSHLFRETVRYFYEPILTDIELAADGLADPLAIVRYFIWRHVRSYIELPELNRLVVVQARQSAAEEEIGVAYLNRRYASVLTKTIAAGVADGSLRSGLEPRLVRDMVFGLIEHVWLRHEAHGERMDAEAVTDDVYVLVEPTLLPPSDIVKELRGEVDRLASLVETLATTSRTVPATPKTPRTGGRSYEDGRRQPS